MKKLIAAIAVGAGVAAGAVAVSSPAWAACGLGADAPTSGMLSIGSRFECGGTVTLTVRMAKDVSFATDPYYQNQQANFGNGDLSTQGACLQFPGAGYYYTWTISSSGNEVESGRVARCA
jgi:ABC-type amino acid transport substrate-binding protein